MVVTNEENTTSSYLCHVRLLLLVPGKVPRGPAVHSGFVARCDLRCSRTHYIKQAIWLFISSHHSRSASAVLFTYYAYNHARYLC